MCMELSGVGLQRCIILVKSITMGYSPSSTLVILQGLTALINMIMMAKTYSLKRYQLCNDWIYHALIMKKHFIAIFFYKLHKNSWIKLVKNG